MEITKPWIGEAELEQVLRSKHASCTATKLACKRQPPLRSKAPRWFELITVCKIPTIFDFWLTKGPQRKK